MFKKKKKQDWTCHIGRSEKLEEFSAYSGLKATLSSAPIFLTDKYMVFRSRELVLVYSLPATEVQTIS